MSFFFFDGPNFDCCSQINSASLMMRTLNKHLTSSNSVTFPSLVANTLYHAYTKWENSTISNVLKRLHTTFVPKSLLDNSAAGELTMFPSSSDVRILSCFAQCPVVTATHRDRLGIGSMSMKYISMPRIQEMRSAMVQPRCAR